MEALSVPLRRSGLVALVDAGQFESLHTFTRRDGESVCVVPSAISWRGVKSKGRDFRQMVTSITGTAHGPERVSVLCARTALGR